MLFTVVVGYTVMLKLSGVPTQPLAVGVTVMVATSVEVVLLVATKEAMFPFPLAAKPIEGLLFDQLKVVPATGLLRLIAAVLSPLQ